MNNKDLFFKKVMQIFKNLNTETMDMYDKYPVSTKSTISVLCTTIGWLAY